MSQEQINARAREAGAYLVSWAIQASAALHALMERVGGEVIADDGVLSLQSGSDLVSIWPCCTEARIYMGELCVDVDLTDPDWLEVAVRHIRGDGDGEA